MTIMTVNTSVESVKVQIYNNNGNYRLVDTERVVAGEIVSRRSIAQLEMPTSLQTDYGKNARWVWCSEYWEGTFPTERLLVLSEYE